MTLREPILAEHPRVTSLSLDFGTDDQECGEQSIQFSEQAMHMRSRWCFEIGTQLAVSFVCQHAELGHQRLHAEGVVVGCEPCGDHPKTYQSTVLFLELPDDLQKCLRELSFQQDSAK